MASPVAQTPLATAFTSSNAWNVPLPAGSSAAGDLLLIFARIAGASGAVSPPSGFVSLLSDSSDASDDVTVVLWKKATGGESGTVLLSFATAQKGVAIVYRISGNADPAVTPPQAALAIFTTAANAGNPPALSPTGGSKDYLAVAFVAFDGVGTVSAAPSGYSGLATNASSGASAATNARAASAVLQTTALSVDPGAFTHTAANSGGTAITVAVHPVGVVAATVPLQAAPVTAGGTLAVGVPEKGGIDAYTVVMLHCDGADGSQTFVDSSPNPHPFTAPGTPADTSISTAHSKFGGASAHFAYTGAAYIYTPHNPDLELGSGDWTIDFWTYHEDLPTAVVYFGKYDQWNPRSYRLMWNYWAGTFSFDYTPDGTTNVQINGNAAFTPPVGRDYHVAVERLGNVLKFFVDGVQLGTDQAITGPIGPSTANLMICNEDTYARYPLVGYLDEFRISVGVARWAGNFSPPISAYKPVVPLGSLNPAVAVAGATLAISVPAAVALNASAAVSSSALALKAAPQVALATSSASSSATLALRAPALVPLSSAAAQSAATLALTATPKISGTAPATSGATLALVVPAGVPLASSPATSGATLAVSIPSAAVTVPLATSAASSSATVALRAPTTVPLASSAASSAATLTLSAPAKITLASSAASSATLALTTAVVVQLASSPATSAASVALTAPARITLASSAASSATLTLSAPAKVLLASSPASSGATLALAATNVPTIGATTAATSSGSLALSAPTRVTLGPSSAVSSAMLFVATSNVPLISATAAALSSSSLTLTAPTRLTLTSAAVSTSTLALTARPALVLGASSATSTATLTLGAPALVALSTATALSGATLALRVPVTILLGASAAVSTSTLAVAVPFAPPLGPLEVVGPILSTGALVPMLVLGAVATLSTTGALAATWASGATGTSTVTGAEQPADTGAVELVTP